MVIPILDLYNISFRFSENMSSALLTEVTSFLETNKKSKDHCPVSWAPKFDQLTALSNKDLSGIDEKLLTLFLDLSHRNWPFSSSENSKVDQSSDILDCFGKISDKQNHSKYSCFRVMIFNVLVKWSKSDKVVVILGKMKYFDKFPSWLKNLMPRVDCQKAVQEDPEQQAINEITCCVMKIACNALSNKTIGKHVFFLCSSSMGSLYRPDMFTNKRPEPSESSFGDALSTFYNDGLHFANEDLALKLMTNGTSAKLRELAVSGQKQASLACVHFDYLYMGHYAKTQGADEKSQMEMAEKQGMSLKEEANNLFKATEISKAYDCYKKSIEIWPYDAKTWGNLALCCQKLNRAKEEKEAAFSCLQKDPNWWKSWCRVGDVLKKKKTSHMAFLAYSVADGLQKSNEISERLSEFNKEPPIDLETEFAVKNPLEFFINESKDKCALFTGYQILKSNIKYAKTLESNVGETITLSAATFGSKTKHFSHTEWVVNIFSHKEHKPISVATNIGKPNASDLKNAFFRAICFPINGKASCPSVMLLAHRFAYAYSSIVEAVAPLSIFVRLETRKEAEIASAKFNTNPNGDNSLAGEAEIKNLQNVYHHSVEE